MELIERDIYFQCLFSRLGLCVGAIFFLLWLMELLNLVGGFFLVFS
jgi:hypothetical protein